MKSTRNRDRARSRPTIVEVIGPAGAGKSTLVTSLCEQSAKVHLAHTYCSFANLLPWLRSGASLIPLLLARTSGGAHSFKERTWMIRVDAAAFILKRLATKRPVVIFDQGPVFTMVRLREARTEDVRSHRFDRWWQEGISHWAEALDVILVLDAPDEILLKRIRERPKRHLIKSYSERAAREHLGRYRILSNRLIDELQERDCVRVMRMDTSRKPVAVVAADALEALQPTTSADCKKGSLPHSPRPEVIEPNHMQLRD